MISPIKCNEASNQQISPIRCNQVNNQQNSSIRSNEVNIQKISLIRCPLVWSEKTKCGVSKNNYDQKLPNGRYSKTHEKL